MPAPYMYGVRILSSSDGAKPSAGRGKITISMFRLNVVPMGGVTRTTFIDLSVSNFFHLSKVQVIGITFVFDRGHFRSAATTPSKYKHGIQ